MSCLSHGILPSCPGWPRTTESRRTTPLNPQPSRRPGFHSGIPGFGNTQLGSGSCLRALGCCWALLFAVINPQIVLEPGGASLGKGPVFIPGISPWLRAGMHGPQPFAPASLAGEERRSCLIDPKRDWGAQPRPAGGSHHYPKLSCLVPKLHQELSATPQSERKHPPADVPLGIKDFPVSSIPGGPTATVLPPSRAGLVGWVYI